MNRFLCRLNASGRMRAGFPRVFGGTPADVDVPYDLSGTQP